MTPVTHRALVPFAFLVLLVLLVVLFTPAASAAATSAIDSAAAVCTSGDDCESGFCPEEDQVCCNEPCDGPNERCDLPDALGVCFDVDLPDGSSCTLSQQCQSRICEGNVCRSAPPRTPTSTRTATPLRQPTLILASTFTPTPGGGGAGGCQVANGSGAWPGMVVAIALMILELRVRPRRDGCGRS